MTNLHGDDASAWTYLLILAGVLAVGVALAPAAAAHNGNGGGVQDGVLEVEDYDTADGDCDPDYDGEHTYPTDKESASGGQFAFAPHSGCGFTFEALELEDDSAFEAVRVRTANCGPAHGTPYTQEIRVLATETGAVGATQEEVASGTVEMTCQGDRYETLTFPETEDLGEGVYDVRLEYEVTSGDPSWINFHGDKLIVDTGQPQPEAQVSQQEQVQTDKAPDEDVGTPAVEAPASCEVVGLVTAACEEPTTVSTPSLEEACDPVGLLCAGPVPTVEVAEVDALCEAAPDACTDETEVVPERTVVEEGTVPSQESPTVGVDVVVRDTDVRIDRAPDEQVTVEERQAEAPFPPDGGGIPVTVCPGGCAADQPADGSASTGADASASVDGETVASEGAETGLP
jgi:hypothetical protein